jgi:hypothetical protein
MIGIKQNISTAYHQQTDGQSKRTNQLMEAVLRTLCNAQGNDWAQWLAIIAYALNSWPNTTTKQILYEVLLGVLPKAHQILHRSHFNSIVECLEAMKLISKQVEENILCTQDQLIKQTHFKPYTFRDLLWLDARNLCTTYPLQKLTPKRYGPFLVTKVISHTSYQLGLPAQWKVHNMFHASYLSPYYKSPEHGENFPKPPPDLINGEKEWEVEQIVGMHKFGHKKTL